MPNEATEKLIGTIPNASDRQLLEMITSVVLRNADQVFLVRESGLVGREEVLKLRGEVLALRKELSRYPEDSMEETDAGVNKE